MGFSFFPGYRLSVIGSRLDNIFKALANTRGKFCFDQGFIFSCLPYRDSEGCGAVTRHFVPGYYRESASRTLPGQECQSVRAIQDSIRAYPLCATVMGRRLSTGGNEVGAARVRSGIGELEVFAFRNISSAMAAVRG
jgi:hypothetical protein